MIDTDKCFGTTTIYCDGEGCDYDETLDGFDGYPIIENAVEEAKENGWTIEYSYGQCYHYCPWCSEERKERNG